MIPGVLYYAGEKNVKIEIDKSMLFRGMQSGQRIFEIEHEGESKFTMIKQVQYQPVTDEAIHIELQRARSTRKMTITVPHA